MKRSSATTIRHPWKQWLSRKRKFCLVKGKDYSCQTHSMAQQFRNLASKMNLRVSIQIRGDQLTISNLGERCANN